ncbi:unnamed protein product, partial [Prunus brigantina]
RRDHVSERYYTPLKTNKEAILAIAGKELPTLRQGRHEYLGKRDETRYCKYHRAYGHSTDDYRLEPIVFTSDDGYTSQPHSDPVVITVGIANCDVNRVLIDGGSSANIIFATVFDELGIGRALLDKTTPPLFAFGGARVQPLGNIHLPLTIGECPRQATTVAHFVVVDCPTTYNVILGRPALTDLGLTISYRTLTLKFRTPHGVGAV